MVPVQEQAVSSLGITQHTKRSLAHTEASAMSQEFMILGRAGIFHGLNC
jgi:hypothetical protein